MCQIKPGRVGHDGGMLIRTYIGIFAMRALVEQRFREGNPTVDDSFMSEWHSLCADQLPVALQCAGDMYDGYRRAGREASRFLSEIVEEFFLPGSILDIDFLDSFYPYVLRRLAEKGLMPTAPYTATGGDP